MTNKIGESKMFKRKSLPVGALFMVLVIMLALLGVGYAFWSEALTIQGTVQTGEVDVEFSGPTVQQCVDVDSGDHTGTCWDYDAVDFPELKKVANCAVVASGPAEVDLDDGANLITVTVTDMYPSYHCKITFDVTSTGSVPVHVKSPEPFEGNPPWIATDFETCYDDGDQLHPGESTGNCTIDIHFTNEEAPPMASEELIFGWTILAHQWNEEPTCEYSVVETGDPPYQGSYNSTVTPVTVTFEDCSTVDAVKEEITTNFQQNQPPGGSAGWAGRSCLVTGYLNNVVGGGVVPEGSTVIDQGPAETGSIVDGVIYPGPYPHGYTYPPPEEGWVVHAAGPTPPTSIYAICGPTP